MRKQQNGEAWALPVRPQRKMGGDDETNDNDDEDDDRLKLYDDEPAAEVKRLTRGTE